MEIFFGVMFIIIVAVGNVKQATIKTPDNLPKNPPVLETLENEK